MLRRFGGDHDRQAGELRLEQVSTVVGGRGALVVVLDGEGGRVSADARGDVTFVCDHATAAGLARGDVNAQRALTSGRLKIRGEVDRLAGASAALTGLSDILAALRADTEF